MIPHIQPFYGKAEKKAIARYLNSEGYLTEHTYTKKFEAKLANFLKVPYVSLVPSGTTALYLALVASLPKGSRVLVPDLTMIATYNAVVAAGMKPVLIDVDLNGCLDFEQIPYKYKGRVDAVIYVELNGRSGDMKKIVKLCKKSKIVLIEDSCQALGSKYKDQYLGTFGKYGCFSLGFHKIITTGQGGFIVSHTKKDYKAIERLKDFGRLKGGNDIHDHYGLNFKYTDLQAVFGLAQLKTIEQRMAKKRQIYKWYLGVEAPEGYIPWFMEYEATNVGAVFNKLNKLGIGCRKMYPPLHTQKSIKETGSFFNATTLSEIILWLPSSLSLTKKEVNYINENL